MKPSPGQWGILTVEYTHTDILGNVYYRAKWEIAGQYTIVKNNILVGRFWLDPGATPFAAGESYNLQNNMNGEFKNLNAKKTDGSWAMWTASDTHREPNDQQNPYWTCKMDAARYVIGKNGVDSKPPGAEKCLG